MIDQIRPHKPIQKLGNKASDHTRLFGLNVLNLSVRPPINAVEGGESDGPGGLVLGNPTQCSVQTMLKDLFHSAKGDPPLAGQSAVNKPPVAVPRPWRANAVTTSDPRQATFVGICDIHF